MRELGTDILTLREQIVSEMDLSRNLADEEVYRIVEEQAGRFSRARMLTLGERAELEQILFNSLRKLDVLQDLLEDSEITEIMVNGTDHIFYFIGNFSNRQK